MITVCNYHLNSNPSCQSPVADIAAKDFYYYDKDGFELNLAERRYYQAQQFPLNDCLNHICWQEPWLEITDPVVFIDHSLILHRANYTEQAQEQLINFKKDIPSAGFLLNTRQKWGFDFALDAVLDDTVFEVIHIEYDNLNYQQFYDRLKSVEEQITKTDWTSAANAILKHCSQWEHLKGYDQNHWKSNFLFGWERAEYLEKAI